MNEAKPLTLDDFTINYLLEILYFDDGSVIEQIPLPHYLVPAVREKEPA